MTLKTSQKPMAVPEEGPTEKGPKRHILRRLFGITLWGWIKLILLCVLVGFLVMAAQYQEEAQTQGVIQALGIFLATLGDALRWAMQNFWQPALLGATIVLPIWFLWRLISLPFRK
ncbi:MAG: DUF6460 domain-containing protein [Pseudomonadota bacterium]